MIEPIEADAPAAEPLTPEQQVWLRAYTVSMTRDDVYTSNHAASWANNCLDSFRAAFKRK